MKKTLAITTILFLFLCSIGFSVYIYTKKNATNKNETIQFPNIDALTLDGEKVNTRTFSGLTSVKVFVFFDPDCDHCKYQINDMVKNKEQFGNLKIIFLSPASGENLKQFVLQMNMDSKYFTILSAPFTEITKKIEFKLFPSTYIFDESNKLIKVFVGEHSSQIILKEIRHAEF